MKEHKYSVQEIDDLRHACREKFVWGNLRQQTQENGRMSRSFYQGEVEAGTENLVRTYMLAGLTAQDLYESEK